MNRIKKRLISILCVVTMLCGLIFVGKIRRVEATETTEKVVEVQTLTDGTVTPTKGTEEYSKDGYVFGGYYDEYDPDTKVFSNPITGDARTATSENPIYIRWVPEEVMTVKAQVRQDEYEGYKRVISNCDGITSDSNIEADHTTSGAECREENLVQEGSASLKRTTTKDSATLFNLYLENTVDVTGYKYFSCKLYIDATSKLVADSNNEHLYIVLSSVDGKINSGALRFYLTVSDLQKYAMSGHEGWYELNLPFANADYINVDSNESTATYNGRAISFIQIRAGQTNENATMTVCVDDIYVYNETPGVLLADCDAFNPVSMATDANKNHTFTSVIKTGTYDSLETKNFKEGTGALKGQCFKHNGGTYRLFTKLGLSDANKLDISGYEKTGSIHLWLYIEKSEYLTGDFTIQLSSSRDDNNRIRYTIDEGDLGDGWNEVIQPLNDATQKTDGFEWNNVNYISVYTTGAIGNGAETDEQKQAQMSEQYMLVDDIRIVDCVQLATCDTANGFGSGSSGIEVTKDDVKQGNGAFMQTTLTSSTVHKLVFDKAIDFSNFKGKNGSLHFWFYIETLESWTPQDGQGLLVRLNDGTNDQDYKVMKDSLRPGWNEIYINLDKPHKNNENFNWTAINSLLLSCENKKPNIFKTMLDDVSLVTGERNTADVRFISAVESLGYTKVGYEITPSYGTESLTTLTTEATDVYRTLWQIGSNGTADPINSNNVSGLNWTEYMHASTVHNIPNRLWNATFKVIPYWITQDGTTVRGEARELTINWMRNAS